MSDVFISYAHSTARQARGAAEALRALGYSVWLDDDLQAHRAFTYEIEQQLMAAKAALVVWSADAAISEWVLSEANRAREAHKLVQLTIDGARLPMPFDQIQCADLSGWSGEGQHPAWSKVAASVADLVRRDGGLRATPAPVPAAAAEPLLAVLAFDNHSGDPEMTYFSDGVSQEILDTVARGSGLKVIGPSSSFQFRGADKAVRKAGAELKATHLLDGSVRRAGQRVRISAHLVECASDTTVWSHRYERDLTDIFALQDEIATSVAAALRTVLPRSPPRPPIDPTAYDLYLRAWAQRARGAFGQANQTLIAAMFEQVVSLAPTFARAWAELAACRALLLRIFRAPGVTRASVLTAAETALALDPSIGRVHWALSWLEPFGRYQVREAMIEKAVAMSPTDSDTVQYMGFFYADVGRWRDSLDYAKRGLDLDPNNAFAVSWYLNSLCAVGRYEEARALCDDYLARWPESDFLRSNAIGRAIRARDWERGEALIQGASEAVTATEDFRDATRFFRNLRNPDPSYVGQMLAFARESVEKTGAAPLTALNALFDLGLKEDMFEIVERASYASMLDPDGPPPSSSGGGAVLFDGSRKPMWADPRFVGLCAKLALCDYWVETGKWPDCADEVPYDFRAEARRLAGRGHP
jgi:TolB-like protein/Tfp pilus assembly protein PilF